MNLIPIKWVADRVVLHEIADDHHGVLLLAVAHCGNQSEATCLLNAQRDELGVVSHAEAAQEVLRFAGVPVEIVKWRGCRDLLGALGREDESGDGMVALEAKLVAHPELLSLPRGWCGLARRESDVCIVA